MSPNHLHMVWGTSTAPNPINSVGSATVTAAVTITRSIFKIEDPSRGPGRVDFRGPDEAFGLEGTPKPKIQRDPSPPKRNLICGPPLYPHLSINIIMKTYFSGTQKSLIFGVWTAGATETQTLK